MILSNVNIGTGPSTGDGDPLRTAFSVINTNFNNIQSNVNRLSNSVTSVAGRSGNVLLSVNDIIGAASIAYVNSVATGNANIVVTPYDNSNVKAYLTSGFDGNILPSANVTYSLGSPTAQWKDLWVSNNTIYIGSVPLSIDSTGQLLVNGNVIQGGGGTANTGNYVFSDDTITNNNGMLLATDRGTLALGTNMEFPGAPAHFHIAFDGSNSSIPSNDLFLGDDYNYVRIKGNAQGVEISANSRNSDPQQYWTFNSNGSMQAPGRIDADGFSGYTFNTGAGSISNEMGNFLIEAQPGNPIQLLTYGVGYSSQKSLSLGVDGTVFLSGNAGIQASDNIQVLAQPSVYVFTVNENNTPGNVAYLSLVDYPAGVNVATGWSAQLGDNSITTVTSVDVLFEGFLSITLANPTLMLGYRDSVSYFPPPATWNFGSNGNLTVPGAVGSTSGTLTFVSNTAEPTIGWTISDSFAGSGSSTLIAPQSDDQHQGEIVLPGTNGDAGVLAWAGNIGSPFDNSMIVGSNNGNVAILLNTGVGSKIWRFGIDDNLTLPSTGYLGKVWGDAGEATLVASVGGYAALANSTGDQYIDADDTGVQIGTNYLSGFGNTWYFSKDGSLTVPGTEDDSTPVIDLFGAASNNHKFTLASDWTLKLKARAAEANQGHLWLEAGQNTKIKVNGNGSTIDLIASDGSTTATWSLNQTGGMVFPDNSTQYTAFSNAAIDTYLVAEIDKNIHGNVTIYGNLFVNGNTTTINNSIYTVDDNIVNFANANPADTLDIGFVGHRTPIGSQLQHTGLVRDASANNWKLFSNVAENPGATVDFTDAIYDDLVVGSITSPTVDLLTTSILEANLGMKGYVDQANTIQSNQIINLVNNQYTNANVQAYSLVWDSDLQPSANVTYNLGAVTNRWNALQVNTINSVANIYSGTDLVAQGNVWSQGGNFRTAAATVFVANTTPTTAWAFGAAATIGIGAASSTTTFGGGTGNISAQVNGFAIGYRDIPQVAFTSNVSITTSDAGKHYYSTVTANPLTLTIANNASQAFSIGAAINIINQGTGNITLSPAGGVTLHLAGNTTEGSRTLSSYGMATITKVATDTWWAVGVGLT